MENRAELFAALSTFQGKMPVVQKNKEVNTGRFKFSYADLASIWRAIQGPLSECGLSVIQMLESDDKGTYMATTIAHSSGQSMTSRLRLDFLGTDIKAAGGAITYYRRYALSTLLGIVTDEDADEIHDEKGNHPYVASKPQSKPEEEERISAKQIGMLHAICKGHPELLEEAKAVAKVDSIKDLPKDRVDGCMQWIKAKMEHLQKEKRSTSVEQSAQSN